MVTLIVVARGYRHVARRASVGMEIILCITGNEFNFFASFLKLHLGLPLNTMNHT